MSHHGGKTQLFVNNASNCKTAFSFHISFLYDFFFSVQFHDSPVRFTVLTSRFATELFSDDSAAPGSEHHGLSSVALGAQQRHDYQPCPRHQEQPLYSSSAGTFKDKHAHKGCSSTTSLLLLIWSFFSLIISILYCCSPGFPTCIVQLGVPHSYLMMSYQYKFQDEDQTKVKGSVKYVCKKCPIHAKNSLLILCLGSLPSCMFMLCLVLFKHTMKVIEI